MTELPPPPPGGPIDPGWTGTLAELLKEAGQRLGEEFSERSARRAFRDMGLARSPGERRAYVASELEAFVRYRQLRGYRAADEARVVAQVYAPALSSSALSSWAPDPGELPLGASPAGFPDGWAPGGTPVRAAFAASHSGVSSGLLGAAVPQGIQAQGIQAQGIQAQGIQAQGIQAQASSAADGGAQAPLLDLLAALPSPDGARSAGVRASSQVAPRMGGPVAAPGTTAPGTTAPGTTAPGMTAPGTTAPGTTAPGMTAPGMTAPWQAEQRWSLQLSAGRCTFDFDPRALSEGQRQALLAELIQALGRSPLLSPPVPGLPIPGLPHPGLPHPGLPIPAPVGPWDPSPRWPQRPAPGQPVPGQPFPGQPFPDRSVWPGPWRPPRPWTEGLPWPGGAVPAVFRLSVRIGPDTLLGPLAPGVNWQPEWPEDS